MALEPLATVAVAVAALAAAVALRRGRVADASRDPSRALDAAGVVLLALAAALPTRPLPAAALAVAGTSALVAGVWAGARRRTSRLQPLAHDAGAAVLALLTVSSAATDGSVSLPLVLACALLGPTAATIGLARDEAGQRDLALVLLTPAVAAIGALCVAGGAPTAVLAVLVVAASVPLAVASWHPPARSSEVELGRAEHVVLSFAAAAATVVLVAGSTRLELDAVTVVLALATQLVCASRLRTILRDVHGLGASQRLAQCDDLTDLLNRRGLLLRLTEELAAGTVRSLLLLDLDHFKEINDSLGHHAGDRLLVATAERLRRCDGDAILARLGGDEFVVVTASEPLRALKLAAEIREALARPLVLDGVTVETQASIGVAGVTPADARPSDLLRHADAAMYRAKQTRSGIELHAARSQSPAADRRRELGGQLRRALHDQEQLVLHYQPQLDLATGSVVALEALVRWSHPTRGLLAPDGFLDLAEEQHLLHDLTLQVLDRALAQRRAWSRIGVDVRIAVNMTPSDLMAATFPDELAERLGRFEVPGDALVLELTETSVMRNSERARDVLARLSELGVGLSLDDFGTGMSSLSRLRRLDVDELKIDRSFLRTMLVDHDDEVIVRTIVELGRSLGLRVVAEGVEQAEQLDRLKDMGCDAVQGHLVTRPLSAARMSLWLLRHRGLDPTAQSVPVALAAPAAPLEPSAQ